MIRARLLAALALAAALAACGGEKAKPQGVQLRRPSAVAAFRGIVFGGSQTPPYPPYLAIANEGRDDISIVSGVDDTPILAPVSLKTLVVPVAQRPVMLVSAPLGDEGDPVSKADLLVAIAADASSLQLVNTWTDANAVAEVTPVGTGSEGDVLAAVAVPTGTPGWARIAVALSGRRVAVVDYVRSGQEITAVGSSVSAPLAFQPVALASIPDGPSGTGDTTKVWAASLEEITPGVLGVAEIDVAAAAPGAPPTFAVRALDARGPTRLVAAARLRERRDGSTDTTLAAFDGQPMVRRVYAVLDESGCGTAHRIDCGVAVLDAAPPGSSPTAGRLLADVCSPQPCSGRMPYLAPIPLPSRPVAIAVSPPPANRPSADPGDAVYQGTLMRLWPASGALATTAAAALPCENGRIYFLDLSRWKVANDANPLATVGGSAISTSVEVRSPTDVLLGSIRLWVADAAGAPLAETATADDVRKEIGVTPGYTRTDIFTVGYQADLPSLTARRAEVGYDGLGRLWLAMQVGSADSVRLWDPGFGVRAGDIVGIQVAGLGSRVPSCAGTERPGAAAGTPKIFEARVAALLQPAADYPGGAVQLEKETAAPVPDPGAAVALWGTCFDGLAAAAASGRATGLTASIRAGGYVVRSDLSGHLGRPVPGAAGFRLEYPSSVTEDALSCPLVPWPDTIAGTACDAACRTGCEALLLARMSRRSYHLAESCPGAVPSEERTACEARWPGQAWLTSPDVAGPVVDFRFALQTADVDVPVEPRRGLQLRITTSAGVTPFAANDAAGQGALVHPNGAAVFDRSEVHDLAGYRFLVPYAADFVIDSTPSLAGGDPVAIH